MAETLCQADVTCAASIRTESDDLQIRGIPTQQTGREKVQNEADYGFKGQLRGREQVDDQAGIVIRPSFRLNPAGYSEGKRMEKTFRLEQVPFRDSPILAIEQCG